jgi:dihydrodiol dehydrogenase / D-xylose 1-dehydrogenase (NADP)
MLLTAGKHVLCEKPLGMNVKETQEMVELAKKQKLFLMEAIWSRCLPSYKKVKELLERGTCQKSI